MGRTKPMVSNEYVVGLTDGEGCFHIKMQEQDRPLLEKVKNTLKCGKVYFQKEVRVNHCQCYRYSVSSQQDISNTIIPFFLKYKLQKERNYCVRDILLRRH